MDYYYIYFKPEHLVEYLKSLKGSFGGKDYEILIALTVRKAYLKIYKDKFVDVKNLRIGFPLKDSFEKELPKNRVINYADIGKFIKKISEEDTLTDIVIGEELKGRMPRRLFVFQLKRFGLGKEKGGGTKELISFLKKYRKDSVTNVLV